MITISLQKQSERSGKRKGERDVRQKIGAGAERGARDRGT
jgi:hypothetical protein